MNTLQLRILLLVLLIYEVSSFAISSNHMNQLGIISTNSATISSTISANTHQTRVPIHSLHKTSLYQPHQSFTLYSTPQTPDEMLKQAAKLRQQAEDIKSALPPRPPPDPDTSDDTNDNDKKTYPNSVLIIGANGSLGSKITRQILRAFFPPPTPVPSSFRVYACVHDYSRSSSL
jgi:FlaA1/EpsC-like NDP-sugar epimerase